MKYLNLKVVVNSPENSERKVQFFIDGMEVHRSSISIKNEIYYSSIWEISYPPIYLSTGTFTEDGVEIAEETYPGWLIFRCRFGEFELICNGEIIMTETSSPSFLKDDFMLTMSVCVPVPTLLKNI